MWTLEIKQEAAGQSTGGRQRAELGCGELARSG